MGQSEVLALLSLVTSLSAPTTDPSLNVLYPIALTQLSRDAPACTGSTADLAITYYIGGMIAPKSTKAGIASEKIDDYAISYSRNPSEEYFAKYWSVVNACNAGAVVSISTMTAGVTREDTLDDLDLDATGILDGSTEDEFV